MRKTVFLLGPADRQLHQPWSPQITGSGENGQEIVLAGILPILNFVMNDPRLKDRCMWYLVGKHKVNIPPGIPLNLFNLVGDADSSQTMLRNIQAIAGKVQPSRVFNRPVDVFKSAREALPQTLAGIPRCRLPRVKAANPVSFEELESVCANFGKWPLILRARGYHGGKHMALLQGPEDLAAVSELAWVYEGILMIEFVDCRRADGLFQKNRVVVVNGEAHVRHAIISDHWSIHSGSRSDLMDGNLDLCRQEEAILAHLKESGLQKFGETFARIHERMGLDVFGVDFVVMDEDIVIFEANACMNFLTQDYGKDDRYGYLRPYVKALQNAIRKMLLRH